MGIFRAIGLGIGIIILKLLVPEVFSALQTTLVTFFDVLQSILAQAPTDFSHLPLPNAAAVRYVPEVPTLHNIQMQGYTD